MPAKTKTKSKTVPPKPSDKDAQAASKAIPPDWPPFFHLSAAEDLSLNILLPNQILTIPGVWTSSLCKTYISFLSALPLVTTPGKPRKGEAVRVNDRYQVNDAVFAERLWSSTALEQLVKRPVMNGKELNDDETRQLWGGEVLGLNSNIRIYRYTPGQYFDRHYDDSNNILFQPSLSPVAAATPAKTTWTLLLYLSAPATGCQGGETVFYPEPPSKREATPSPVITDMEVGMALLHRHGKDCLLHESREVTEGVKWVIRSDLCVAR